MIPLLIAFMFAYSIFSIPMSVIKTYVYVDKKTKKGYKFTSFTPIFLLLYCIVNFCTLFFWICPEIAHLANKETNIFEYKF